MTPHIIRRALREFFDDYEWIHLTLGIIGNFTFVVGSVFFLYENLKTAGTWLFIIGSALMFVGAVGSALVRYVRHHEEQKSGRR